MKFSDHYWFCWLCCEYRLSKYDVFFESILVYMTSATSLQGPFLPYRYDFLSERSCSINRDRETIFRMIYQLRGWILSLLWFTPAAKFRNHGRACLFFTCFWCTNSCSCIIVLLFLVLAKLLVEEMLTRQRIWHCMTQKGLLAGSTFSI